VNQVAPYRDGPAGVHGVLGQAATAVCELARLAGLEPLVVPDVVEIPDDAFEPGSVLALFNIGETPWSASQRRTITDAVKAGRIGVLGIHSATDACRDWDDYGPMLGARFDGHPWTTDFPVEVVDRDHPSTAPLPHPWHWRDEVYLFTEPRTDARILLRLDAGHLDMSVPGARVPAWGLPLAWCHRVGEGRSFYTALGHFPSAWESPLYLRHLAGAIEWLQEADA